MALNYLAAAPYASFVTRNGTFHADGNGLISNVNAGAQALDLFASGCVPLAINHFANFRNLLDGGDFSINPFQRNIPGLATGGVIATPIGATPTYFADRFFAAGGASSAILMAAVADLSVAGFNQSLKISRQAGNASLATINVGQALETFDSVRCQGQTVTLSFWAKAGANYSGGALTTQVIAGAGVNQSAATLVAGAWTSAAYLVNAAQALTRSMTRYQFSGVVPATATQIAMLLSFTPTGTAGADDSISISGVQLEIGPSASPFEHIDAQVALEICQRYAWAIPEPAAAVVIGAGANIGAATQLFYIATPVQLLRAPTVTVAAGTFKTNQAGVAAATTISPEARRTRPTPISINGNSAGSRRTAGRPAAARRGRLGMDPRQRGFLIPIAPRRSTHAPLSPPTLLLQRTGSHEYCPRLRKIRSDLMKDSLATSRPSPSSTGLTAYDSASAREETLYPTITPLPRNSMPHRVARRARATRRWRTINSITGSSGYDANGLGAGRPSARRA